MAEGHQEFHTIVCYNLLYRLPNPPLLVIVSEHVIPDFDRIYKILDLID